MNAEQLNSARLARWSQNGEARLTQESASEWLSTIGFCPFLPMYLTSGAPSASFVEAVVGRPASAPSAGERARATELLVRLVANSAAVPLKLGESPGEQPDYVASPGVLPYLYALRGSRDWKTAPSTNGNGKVSPLAQDCWRGLEQHGALDVMALQQAIGGDVTETAGLRALHELWRGMYVIPLASADGKPAQWELLSRRFPEQVGQGARSGYAEALSALISLYLAGVVAATEEEILDFLSPVATQSKLREVIRGLAAMRQLDMIDVAGRPHVCLLGGLLQEIGEQMSEVQLAASATRHAPKQPWKPRPKVEERTSPRFNPRDVGERRPARTYEPAAKRRSMQASDAAPAREERQGSRSEFRNSGMRPPASRFSKSGPSGSKPFAGEPGSKPWANRSGQSPRDTESRPPRPAERYRGGPDERPRHAGATRPSSSGSKPFGAKKQFGAKRPFGDKRTFGDRPWAKRTPASGSKPRGDFASPASPHNRDGGPKRWEKPESSAPAGAPRSKPFGAKSFGSKPFRPKPFGSKPGGAKPWVKRAGKRKAGTGGGGFSRNSASSPGERPKRPSPTAWQRSGSASDSRPARSRPFGSKPWAKRDSGSDRERREQRPDRAPNETSGGPKTGSDDRPKRTTRAAGKPSGGSGKKPFWTKNPHGGKGSPRASRTNRPRGKKK